MPIFAFLFLIGLVVAEGNSKTSCDWLNLKLFSLLNACDYFVYIISACVDTSVSIKRLV